MISNLEWHWQVGPCCPQVLPSNSQPQSSKNASTLWDTWKMRVLATGCYGFRDWLVHFFTPKKKTLFAQLYCLVSYFESKSIPFPKFISKKNSTMAPFPSSTLLKPFGSFRVHRTGCLWSIIDGGDLCGVNYSARFFFGIPGAGSEDLGGFGVCHNHLKQP